jgi:hypothetical protein
MMGEREFYREFTKRGKVGTLTVVQPNKICEYFTRTNRAIICCRSVHAYSSYLYTSLFPTIVDQRIENATVTAKKPPTTQSWFGDTWQRLLNKL